MNKVEKNLIDAGFRVWEKGGHRRIYVDSTLGLEKVFGLVLEFYKSGNIKSAELRGEYLSNSKARRICLYQPYYDCIKEKWIAIGCDPLPEFSE